MQSLVGKTGKSVLTNKSNKAKFAWFWLARQLNG